MKTHSLSFLLILLFSCCWQQRAMAQVPTCSSDVPFYSVDLTGFPSGSWISPSHVRQGACCTSTTLDRCTSFTVTLDTAAIYIRFEIIAGSIPGGVMYYQVGCGPLIPVGSLMVVTGPGPVNLTFCKPGNNPNTYRIGTISKLDTVITGTRSITLCGTTDLDIGVAGGTWSSSNTAVATVNSSTGVVTSVSPGTATISYTFAGTVIGVTTVTVNAVPPITGTLTVCVGGTTTLSDAASGGVWSSSNVTRATVGSTGVVSGVSTGTSTITYSLGSGCISTSVVTVTQTVPAITGPMSVCVGLTTTLTDATAGGTWSSGSTSIGTINPTTGIVIGVAAGTANITYTIAGGCRNTAVLTVNALPSAISGTATVCVGSTTTLSDAPSGGAWSSSDASVATIGSASGVVSGIAAGTTTITYTTAAGCQTTKSITANPTPVVTGTVPICVGATMTLSSSIAGGTWSPKSAGIATVGSTSGIVSGVSAGQTTITYALPTGCRALTPVTINPVPVITNVAPKVCVGDAITLTANLAGGTWSSSNASVSSVGSSGVATGIAAGTAFITYQLPTGCRDTAVLVVNPLPASISGATTVCVGSTVSLTDVTAAGTWSSGNVSIATIGSLSGVLSGITSGVTSVTYTGDMGCRTMAPITVNATPVILGAPAQICAGAIASLSGSIVGGTWSSSAPGFASIDLSGVVIGVAAGTVFITYQLPTGCKAAAALVVNPLPAAISGPALTCVDGAITLSNALAGGAWNSGNAGVATVGSSSGVVSGIATGNAPITYTSAAGCRVTQEVTVMAQPVISGTPQVCEGQTTALSCAMAGGAWSSSDITMATVDAATGAVLGIGAGNPIISYTTSWGCQAAASITVNVTPAPLTGNNRLCITYTTTLSCSLAGGVWTSGNPDTATVDALTGVVHGVGPGTAMITYTVAGGCIATSLVKVSNYVYPLETQPLSTPLRTNICLGNTLGLNSPLGGDGLWTTSDITRATVTNLVPGSLAPWGVVSALSLGTVTISYTAYNGCVSTHTITINAMPVITSIAPTVCRYGTTTLNATPAGGQWISHNITTAQVTNYWTGVVHASLLGVAEIAYRLFTYDQCGVNILVTVNACTPREDEAGGANESSVGYVISPNPGTGNFTITQNVTADGLIPVRVVNCLGQSVYNGSVAFVGGNGTLDLLNVAPGIYLVALEGKPGDRKVMRIAVQK